MNILVISFWCPYPADNGSRQRAYHLIKQLSESGHKIRLLALAQAETDLQSAQDHLGPLCADGVQLFHSRQFRPAAFKAIIGYFSVRPRHVVDTYEVAFSESVQHELRSRRFSVALCFELGSAVYVPPVPSIPCVLDQIEVSPFVKAAAASRPGIQRLRRSLTLYKLRSYLRVLSRRFVTWTTVSEAEAQAVRSVCGQPEPPIVVVANGVEIAGFSDDVGYKPSDMVYNGSVNFSANEDAVRWFISDILPIIKKERPDAELIITGRNDALSPSDPLRKAPGVRWTGFVEDVKPVVAACAVCVVPLREGGGTRLKILEAMSLGVPVVSTHAGAEGIAVTDGVDISLESDPEKFAAAVLSILADPPLRKRLGSAGRALVEAEYDWKFLGDQLQTLLTQYSEKIVQPCL